MADDDIEEDLSQGAGRHQDDVGSQTALGAACRYVDEMLADPHMEHGHCNGNHAHQTDRHDAHAEACRCLP